jgi:hypothetical protein
MTFSKALSFAFSFIILQIFFWQFADANIKPPTENSEQKGFIYTIAAKNCGVEFLGMPNCKKINLLIFKF